MGAPTARKAAKKAASRRPRKVNGAIPNGVTPLRDASKIATGLEETPPPHPMVIELTAKVDELARQVEVLKQLAAKLLAAQIGPQLQQQLADKIMAGLNGAPGANGATPENTPGPGVWAAGPPG